MHVHTREGQTGNAAAEKFTRFQSWFFMCVAGEDFKLDKSLSVGTCPVLDPLIHPLTLSF